MFFDLVATPRPGGMKNERNASTRINFVLDAEHEFTRTLALNATTGRNCISATKRDDIIIFVRTRGASGVRCSHSVSVIVSSKKRK